MTEAPAQELIVYADAVTKVQSRGMRTGRMVAPAPMVVPARWSHAAIDGSANALCGQSTSGLHYFPAQTFRTLNPYLRCRECDELAGRPTPSMTDTPGVEVPCRTCGGPVRLVPARSEQSVADPGGRQAFRRICTRASCSTNTGIDSSLADVV